MWVWPRSAALIMKSVIFKSYKIVDDQIGELFNLYPEEAIYQVYIPLRNVFWGEIDFEISKAIELL